MARATVELDFFGLEEDNSSKSRFPKFVTRQRSFRDIQSAISKINPELLKSVITSGSANQQSAVNGNQIDSKVSYSAPKEEQSSFPVFSSFPRAALENPPQTAPLTIFYKGAVAVFDVPRDKAETILKLAENGISMYGESTDNKQQMLQALDGDLPIARRKSLQRFLEKRKERLTSVTPYGCHPESHL